MVEFFLVRLFLVLLVHILVFCVDSFLLFLDCTGHLLLILVCLRVPALTEFLLRMVGCIQVEADQRAQDCLLPMGITSENVAERYGVGRKQQDAAAVCLSPSCCY